MQIHCSVSFVSGICQVEGFSTTGKTICYLFPILYLTGVKLGSFNLHRNMIKIDQTLKHELYIYFTEKTTSVASVLGSWLTGKEGNRSASTCVSPPNGVTFK